MSESTTSTNASFGQAILGRLEVEVERGTNFFKASAIDFLDKDIVVEFEDKSLPRQTVSMRDCRLAGDSEELVDTDVLPGDEVEVRTGGKDAILNAYGWRKAKILQKKGTTFIVSYHTSDGGTLNEIIDSMERLRHPNGNPSLAEGNLYKCVIELPENASKVCSDVSLHRDLFKVCQADCLVCNRETNTIILLSRTEKTIRAASLLAEMHFRNTQTKLQLRNRQTQEAARSRLVKAQFAVPDHAMGLVIGKRGANIRACRQHPGIVRVDVDADSNTICVLGESTEAVDAVRKKLEYCEETFHVRREIAARIIGKRGSNIQQIAESSGVVKLSPVTDHTSDGATLQIFGLRETVESAIAQLEEAAKALSARIYREEFVIAEAMVGLTIGRRGVNIKACRNMEGIIDVKFDARMNTMEIVGKTQEVVQSARKELEICEKNVSVAKNLAGRIIGKRGTNIHSIVELSEVISAVVDDDGPDNVVFTFTGRSEAVERACVLLEYDVLRRHELDTVVTDHKKVSQSQTSSGSPHDMKASDRKRRSTRRVWYQERHSD